MNYYKEVIFRLNIIDEYPESSAAAVYVQLLRLLGEGTFNRLVEHGDHTGGFDSFWFRFHKGFRQMDVYNNITVINTLDGVEPNASLDSIFWEFIHVDPTGVLYSVMKQVIPE